MRAPSAAELLAAWEQALGQPPLARPLALLSSVTGEGQERLALLGVGERDARLLSLRELTFGPRLLSVADCPACGERLEMSFEVAELRAAPSPVQETYALTLDGHEVLFRLPNTLDLAALAPGADEGAARRRLLERCLLSARRGDDEVAAADLPPEVLEAVAERMGEADPQGDVQLALACPACGHVWQEPFDIGQFLWAEVHAWATRVLGEVHKLARAYGWRESDILALSPVRRQFYLDMIGG